MSTAKAKQLVQAILPSACVVPNTEEVVITERIFNVSKAKITV